MAAKGKYLSHDEPSMVPLYDQLQAQLCAGQPMAIKQPQYQPGGRTYPSDYHPASQNSSTSANHYARNDQSAHDLEGSAHLSYGRDVRLEEGKQTERTAARRQRRRKPTNPCDSVSDKENKSGILGTTVLNNLDTGNGHKRQVTNPFEPQTHAQYNAVDTADTQAANKAQEEAERESQRKVEDRVNEKASCSAAMKTALAKGIERVARRNTLVNGGNYVVDIDMQERQNKGEYRAFQPRYDLPASYYEPQPPIRTFTLRSPWPTVMPPNYQGPIMYPVINGHPDMEHPVFPGGFDTPKKDSNNHGPTFQPLPYVRGQPRHPITGHSQPMSSATFTPVMNPTIPTLGTHQESSAYGNYGAVVSQQYGHGGPLHQSNINALQKVIDNNARILESFYALNRPDIARNQGYVNTSIPRTGSPKLVPKTPSPLKPSSAPCPTIQEQIQVLEAEDLGSKAIWTEELCRLKAKRDKYHAQQERCIPTRSPCATRMDANVVQMTAQEHNVMYTDQDDKVMNDIDEMMGQLTAKKDSLTAALEAVKLDIKELEKVKCEENLRRLNPKASTFVPAIAKNCLPKAMKGASKLDGSIFPIINEYSDGRCEISHGRNLKEGEFAGKNLMDTFKAMRKQEPKERAEEKGAAN